MATERGPGPARSSQDDRLVDAIVRSAFATMAVLNKVAADHDLSLTQLRVLAILRDRRLRMSELAHHLGLEKSTMSGLVDRAEQRGLLARGQRDGDRRAIEVFLTPAGAELAGRGSVLIAGLLLPATDGLSPAERRRLQALLERTVARDDPDRARIN